MPTKWGVPVVLQRPVPTTQKVQGTVLRFHRTGSWGSDKMTPEKPKRAFWVVPGLRTPPRFHEKTTKRRPHKRGLPGPPPDQLPARPAPCWSAPLPDPPDLPGDTCPETTPHNKENGTQAKMHRGMKHVRCDVMMMYRGRMKNYISNSKTERKCNCIWHYFKKKKRCKDDTVFSNQLIWNIGMNLPLHLHLHLHLRLLLSPSPFLLFSPVFPSLLCLSSLFSLHTETDFTSHMIPPSGAGLDVKFTREASCRFFVVCC